MSKEGWLSKEGGAIKSWKKRWFVLEGDELVYYSKQGGEKKGSISLKEVSEAKPEEYKDKKNCFKIVTTGRTYYLSAPTPEDLKKWVDLIKEDIKKKKNKGNDNNAPKQVGIDDFETLKMIGSGGFGKVLQVRYKPTGQVMAMKVLNKKAIVEADEVEKTMTEKNILIKLDSPFLVNLHFAFQTPGKIIFVMDYINGGELFYHLQQQERGFDTDRVRFYAAEILLGIEYLHAKGVVYRDLKPENILINKDGHICMTDFGISKEGLVSKDDRTATFCGTPEYLAPEVLQGKKYGKEVDWWSFGTLIFEMLTGMPPFYSDDVQQMYRKILNEPVDRDAIAKYDPSAVDIILGLLERDVSKRLSNPDIIKKHPYFRPINWDKLSKREIKPPFVPQVRGEDCTGNIDPTFTRQKAALTITSPDVLSQTAQDKFLNFTYIAKSELND